LLLLVFKFMAVVLQAVHALVQQALQGALDGSFERFMGCLAAQRLRNRSIYERSEDRRAAMLASADGFDMAVRVRYPAWFVESLKALAPQRGGER